MQLSLFKEAVPGISVIVERVTMLLIVAAVKPARVLPVIVRILLTVKHDKDAAFRQMHPDRYV